MKHNKQGWYEWEMNDSTHTYVEDVLTNVDISRRVISREDFAKFDVETSGFVSVEGRFRRQLLMHITVLDRL